MFTLTFCFLELFFGFIFLFNNSINFYIIKLNLKFINCWLRTYWKCILYSKKLINWVNISLFECNINQTISNLKVIIYIFQWNKGSIKLYSKFIRLTHITATSMLFFFLAKFSWSRRFITHNIFLQLIITKIYSFYVNICDWVSCYKNIRNCCLKLNTLKLFENNCYS